MKYNEVFTEGHKIFTDVFKTEYADAYTAIFGDTQPEKLDTYALMNFAGKDMLSVLTPDNVNEFVTALIAVHVQGWQREAAAMLAEYDVTKPITGDITRHETVTSEETNNGTDTRADKAFNDTDFSDHDKTTTDGGKTGNETREISETRSGTGEGKSISSEIAKEMQLRLDKWRKNIIFAIVNELAISIYE